MHHGDGSQTDVQDAVASRSAGAPVCAVGIPVAVGLPALPLPGGKRLFHLAMQFIEQNDYHALFELARSGFSKVFDDTKRCIFACDLKPDVCISLDGRHFTAMPQRLDVKGASLLQYAVCTGGFRAAMALVIICPEYLQTTCTVVLSSAKSTMQAEWSTTDLIRFFCRLYSPKATTFDTCQDVETEAEIVEVSEMFRRSLPVFEIGEADPSKLPFLHLPSVAARVTAAGGDPDPVIEAFCSAADACHISLNMECD